MSEKSAKTPATPSADRGVIHIEGARHHNLKNLSLDIPREKLVVVCGPSGSGKSTLAFDIVYAEGQRRYVESLSAYARQFLPQMDKPLVDKVEGLSPAISLEQQSTSRNPRSTVGTVTEVYDFLRVFFARLGTFFCPKCGQAIAAQSGDEILSAIMAMPEGVRILLLAPLVEHQKGTHKDLFAKLRKEGFARARVNGEVYPSGRGAGAGQAQEAHHRARGGPSGHQARHSPAPGRFRGAGPAPRQGQPHRQRAWPLSQEGGQGCRPLLQHLQHLRHLRHLHARAGPGAVLLQQPPGRLPGMLRPGHRGFLRVRPAGAEQGPFAQGGRAFCPGAIRAFSPGTRTT
jgi:Excinuclease ATPase subunit